MTDPADYQMRARSTWAQDLGALRATADYLAENPNAFDPSVTEIAAAIGLDEDQLRQSLQRWERTSPAALVSGEGTLEDPLCVRDLTERGRQIVGLWPSPEQVIDRLIRALEEAAADEPDEAKRSKLKAAGVALATIARDIGVAAVGQTLGGVM